ncbi:MAG: addiction module killer protein [Gammaproteobacteria bacterium RIFCSPHIGHO2_12_FULL_45_9]|nr:MAG: addiction module killer protein [Gammaproteobacteria bacterium RIFCSPHIGHO2_12_FULL_45_9]
MKSAQLISLEIYATDEGRVPFIEWLDSLKDKMVRYRIKERLDRISLGNWGDHKPIAQGVLELRFDFGSGYRVYFGRKADTIVLLLCGGDKRSQKKDIKKAIQYWQDYLGGVNQ